MSSLLKCSQVMAMFKVLRSFSIARRTVAKASASWKWMTRPVRKLWTNSTAQNSAVEPLPSMKPAHKLKAAEIAAAAVVDIVAAVAAVVTAAAAAAVVTVAATAVAVAAEEADTN